MIKRLALLVLLVGMLPQYAVADWDWDEHRGRDSDFPADPNFDAFMWTVIPGIGVTALLLLFSGPIIVIWGRRIRDTFWIVPLANFLLYVLSITLRSYPGGFAARFRVPGLAYTITEILLLLVISLCAAVIIAAVQWVVRKSRSLLRDIK